MASIFSSSWLNNMKPPILYLDYASTSVFVGCTPREMFYNI
jgi:hypothetical protein